MEILKSVKSDADIPNLARYCAWQEGVTVFEAYDNKSAAALFYEGIEGFKGNPQRVNEFFEHEFDWQDEEYGEDETNQMLTKRFKDFFRV